MSKNDITVKIFGGNSSIVPLVDLKSIKTKEGIEKRTISLTKNILKNLDFI